MLPYAAPELIDFSRTRCVRNRAPVGCRWLDRTRSHVVQRDAEDLTPALARALPPKRRRMRFWRYHKDSGGGPGGAVG